MEDPLAGVLGRLDEQIKSGQRKKALRTVEEGRLAILFCQVLTANFNRLRCPEVLDPCFMQL